MKYYKKKSKRSLRTIVITWFLILSFFPLAFVAYYSTLKFEQAIDKELLQRLSVNAREVEVILTDFKVGLRRRRDRYVRDPVFIYNISVGDQTGLITQAEDLIKSEISSELIFFNREGRQISKTTKDSLNKIQSERPILEGIFLSDKYISFLKTQKEIGVIEFNERKVQIGLISRILNSNQKIIGYLEQIINLDNTFLNRLKNRIKLEVFLAKEDGDVLASTFKENDRPEKDRISKVVYDKKDSIFEVSIRSNPYGFYLSPIEWGFNRFILGLGVSKSDSREVLSKINLAFYGIVGIVMIFLFITAVITSNWVLNPLYELVEALQSFETQEQAVTIPVKNDTEIGLLTESFNQMSINISQVKSDLRKKVKELEDANQELKETQKKLIHSAKMISLGELVAGVAHELNNPISFIYSNMTHLKEYSDKLIDLIRTAESQPDQIELKKQEIEYDYIVKDLPKLISSCEEGARRTRDIVLGLRNFSRIDEAQLQEIDLRDTIDTTLSLLQGEIKNRIAIKKNYENIPSIECYASQINQVFVNLLSNAIQAIPETGTIWITIQFNKADKNKEFQISIQDTGKGIKPEFIDKIFDPFFTTKAIGQGTGLGLSITYGIIQKHGGDIQVKSQVDVGTEFIVYLPAKPKTS